MTFRLSIRELITRLIACLLFSVFLGYLFGNILLVVSLTCLLIIAWHYRHISLLITWLWQSKAISPPESKGVWGHIYNGLYRKIKNYRQKQKILNDKIRQFRDGAEALPDAAIVLSNDLLVLWGNKKAQQLLGIRWPGDVGQRIDNLIRFPEFSFYLEQQQFELPCHISSPVNSELQLELRFMAYGADQMLLLARDVSKLYRLENMRRDFVANVSHELKTPLTVVRGYVEMIQTMEQSLEPHWQKAFSSIETQVTRMDRLVEQLLVLSRVEINDEVKDKQLVNLSTLIAALLDDVKWLNQDKQHHISVDIEPMIGLMGSETELKSACANILANAIAYTPARGKIHVCLQQAQGKIKFSVKDNGVGIKPEHINRLTERFYRIDQSRSRDTGGSGLGLAIVKHVLHHHHAELVIKSENGTGSEFIIIFETPAF